LKDIAIIDRKDTHSEYCIIGQEVILFVFKNNKWEKVVYGNNVKFLKGKGYHILKFEYYLKEYQGHFEFGLNYKIRLGIHDDANGYETNDSKYIFAEMKEFDTVIKKVAKIVRHNEVFREVIYAKILDEKYVNEEEL